MCLDSNVTAVWPKFLSSKIPKISIPPSIENSMYLKKKKSHNPLRYLLKILGRGYHHWVRPGKRGDWAAEPRAPLYVRGFRNINNPESGGRPCV